MILNDIFPLHNVTKMNKLLRKQIQDGIDIPDNIDNMDLLLLQKEYDNTFDAKNKFEDKAKTIVAALTIAITLILNLYDVVEIINNKYSNKLLYLAILVLVVSAIIYMAIAGILAIQVLIKENYVYPIPLDKEDEDKKKRTLFDRRELNIKQNIIRNNFIFGAYQCIRNSLFLLMILFVLTIIPVENKEQSNIQTVPYNNSNILFTDNAISWIKDNPNIVIDYNNIVSLHSKDLNKLGNANIILDKQRIVVNVILDNNKYIINNIGSNVIR